MGPVAASPLLGFGKPPIGNISVIDFHGINDKVSLIFVVKILFKSFFHGDFDISHLLLKVIPYDSVGAENALNLWSNYFLKYLNSQFLEQNLAELMLTGLTAITRLWDLMSL